MITQQERRPDTFARVFLILLAVFCALQDVCCIASEGMNYSDGSIYQYIGHLITIGKMPYTSAFDHKGPILYLLNALGCLIETKHGIWIIDTISMVALFLAAYTLCRRFLSPLWSVAVVSVTLSGIVECYWIGNTPDFFAAVFTMFIVTTLSNYFLCGALTWLQIACVGLFSSLCFWLKYTTILFAFAFCFCIVLHAAFTKRFAFILQCLGGFSIGFLIPSIAVVLWLLSKGALKGMVENYFAFNLSYGGEQGSLRTCVQAFIYFLSAKSGIVAISAAVLFFLMPHSSHEPKGTDGLMASTCFSLLIQAIILSVAGREYVHYNIVLYPAFVVLVCLTVTRIKHHEQARHDLPLFAALLALFVLIPNLKAATEKQRNTWASSPNENVVEIVQAYTSVEDMIAVASPDHCGLYLWTERESATTYPYIQASFYNDADRMELYNEQISTTMPKIIVWNTNWPVRLLGVAAESYTTYYPTTESNCLALLFRNDMSVDAQVLSNCGYSQ